MLAGGGRDDRRAHAVVLKGRWVEKPNPTIGGRAMRAGGSGAPEVQPECKPGSSPLTGRDVRKSFPPAHFRS